MSNGRGEGDGTCAGGRMGVRAKAATVAPRSVSGVIGLRRKSAAPIRMASTASSIDAYAVTITTQASGARCLICRRVSRPSRPGILWSSRTAS